MKERHVGTQRAFFRDTIFIKTEVGLDDAIPVDRRAAELMVFNFIEGFYNRTRRHSSLGHLSPAAFEKQPTNKDRKTA